MRRAPAQADPGAGEMPQEAPAPPPAQQGRPPTPGQVRRERRALVRAREDRIRDLGGLMLEMYKRDRLKPELFFEQCAELVSIEERIQELDGALAAITKRTMAEANRCSCGAPLVWGAISAPTAGGPSERLRSSPAPTAATRCRRKPPFAPIAGVLRSRPRRATRAIRTRRSRPSPARVRPWGSHRLPTKPTRLSASKSTARRRRARSCPNCGASCEPYQDILECGLRLPLARGTVAKWEPRGSSGRPGSPGTGSGLSCFCC